MSKNTLEFSSNLKATDIPFQKDLTLAAAKIVTESALPNTRVENWKYTRVAKIGKIPFQNSTQEISNINTYLIDSAACNFVFVNGHFSAELSSKEIPTGVSCKLLSEEDTIESSLQLDGEVFNALNTAYLTNGLTIKFDSNAIVEKPIQVIHVLKGDHEISNFKLFVAAGKSSQGSVIQGYFCENGTSNFCNVTSEISVEENAHLTIDKIQYEAEESYHINTELVNQDKNSTFTINTITLNGGLVRNNLNIAVNGENCTTNLNGAYLLKNKQHVDNHTIVDHKVPNCNSNELYKGVVDDKSTAVFNGKVFVRENAQKIAAFQSNGNVLLSDDASVNSKPELEIYADDVKCSHGSTTGQLDDDAIFYLQARGLSKKSAHQLMVAAFIGEVLEKIENENVIRFTHRLLSERFGWDLIH